MIILENLNTPVTFTDKLAIKKDESLEKPEKDRRIRKIVEILKDLALKNPLSFTQMSTLRTVRLDYKLENSRLSITLECSSREAILPYSRLTIGKDIFCINDVGTRKIIRILQNVNPGIGKGFGLKTSRMSPDDIDHDVASKLRVGLNGNRMEVTDHYPTHAAADDFWNDWKDWVDSTYKSNPNAYLYQNEIYPACLACLRHIVKTPSSFLEVCGGNGDFAKLVLQDLGAHVLSYDLVERNHASLQKARTSLHDPRVNIVETDILETPLPNKKFDIVIGIGALTRTVVPSRSDAQHVLEQIAQRLKPGGFLLLSGISSQWLCSHDLEKFGFCVKNKLCPQTGRSLYLAQRNEVLRTQKSLLFTSKLAIEKETRLEKQEKDRKVRQLIEDLKNTAQRNALSHIPEPALRKINLDFKLEGRRVKISLECSRAGALKPFSKLTIDEQTYCVNHIGTKRILKIVQDPEDYNGLSLNGNRMELIDFYPKKALSDEFWDDWKYKRLKDVYQKEIYPLCLAYLEEMIQSPSAILELCGGDGEFANLALNQLDTQITKYHLIDRNVESLRNACWSLEDPRAVISQVDILIEPLPHEKFDIIIGIGALTRSVIPNRLGALQVLDKIVMHLKPQGFLLLAGLDSQWLSSDDLEMTGFSVKNMYCPKTGNQLYLAQNLNTYPESMIH